MTERDQEQEINDGSQGYQAGRDIHITNNGLSYREVRQVALDVYKANMMELSVVAREVAGKRAEEITEVLISKLMQEFPKGFEKANDPDFQHGLFSVQKEFARSGDKNLGKLLVELLVEKTKLPSRTLSDVALNEALATAPKLTNQQLGILSTLLFCKSYLPRKKYYLGSSGSIGKSNLLEDLKLSVLETFEFIIVKKIKGIFFLVAVSKTRQKPISA